MMTSSPTISATFLGILAAIESLPFVAAFVAAKNITTDQLYGKLTSTATPAPGFNVKGGSVFTNFADMVNNGQFFFRYTGEWLMESPESEPLQFTFLDWCSDLTFSDFSNSSLIGYAGRCVYQILVEVDADIEDLEAGLSHCHTQLADGIKTGEFIATTSISAVFEEQQNVFEGQFHVNADDFVYRFWDSGLETMPAIGWEGHDEGDMSPNAASTSWGSFNEFTWMSVEEVAKLFNTTVDEFTPEKFKEVYKNTWIKGHEFEAANANPNPGAELEIIEQVKGETNVTPNQPDSTEGDGVMDNDDANLAVDDSGSGRKLSSSVAARFVSAGLRIFGI